MAAPTGPGKDPRLEKWGTEMNIKTVLKALLVTSVMAPVTARAEVILTALPDESTAWVENFNPFNTTTRVPSVEDFMYEPLVIFNAIKDGEPNYRLAESFAYSDDLKSVTFKLRDVKWSDGKPFTAKDVVFTFNMIKQHKALDLQAIWDQIDGIEAVDDHTVKINYKSANSGLIFKIVQIYIVPEHVWASVKDPVSFTNPNPVGSGPLTEIRRFTPQEYVQCRNPNYWDNATLKVDCMRFPQVAGNDQTIALAAKGELDWFGSFLPDIEKTYVGTDPKHHGYWFPAGSMVSFTMNFETANAGNHAAFNNLAFRRAFSMAMDRQAMVDIAGYGYPTLNEYPSGLGRAFHSWNDPKVDEKYGAFSKYNIEGAKAELAKAGFKDTDGDGFVENPDGSKISFDIIVPNGWTDWVNTCQLAIEGLTEVGIQAKLATPDVPGWTDALMTGKYDVAINSFRTGVTPHFMYDEALNSRNKGKTRYASAHYSNPELDALLNSFYTTNDHAKQVEIMNKIQEVIGANMPFVAVFNNPLWYEYNTKRFTGWFNADNPVARPVVYGGVPERLLHLLALRPVAQ
jgi:peptide/nickel transport system substrate-binding protein